MSLQRLLLVESDILVRHALAQYLRECGFDVLEAAHSGEARTILADGHRRPQFALVEACGGADGGFALAQWIRANHPGLTVTLAGSMSGAAEAAGDLCEKGPRLRKPYDHQLVLDHIRRLAADHERNGQQD